MDEQLRGRAGRQGDPGRSVFHASLDDELVRTAAIGAPPLTEQASTIAPSVASRLIEAAQKRHGDNPWRRATAQTVSPLVAISATIRTLSA
ncbi:hypothetical protein [Nitrobacter sp. TKz-YC01]|uniref:preprotein translocase subunit SecA n=1 Tax=Nitrobacter sp. TKz-YC01 TaxID=3398703 RepID=UPI003A0FE2CC